MRTSEGEWAKSLGHKTLNVMVWETKKQMPDTKRYSDYWRKKEKALRGNLS